MKSEQIDHLVGLVPDDVYTAIVGICEHLKNVPPDYIAIVMDLVPQVLASEFEKDLAEVERKKQAFSALMEIGTKNTFDIDAFLRCQSLKLIQTV